MFNIQYFTLISDIQYSMFRNNKQITYFTLGKYHDNTEMFNIQTRKITK